MSGDSAGLGKIFLAIKSQLVYLIWRAWRKLSEGSLVVLKAAEINDCFGFQQGFFLTRLPAPCYGNYNIWSNSSVLEYAFFKEGLG
jgi:hypothetical protein